MNTPSLSQKKRFAIVGLGGRSAMFLEAILKDYSPMAELVAFCDINPRRMEYWNRSLLESKGMKAVPCYAPDQFEAMVAQEKPDTLIVTCIDRAHHEYIVRGMNLGLHIISEKPLTIDEEKIKEIERARKMTGKTLTVTFNYRYSPRNTKIKELISKGEIGEVVNVHFEWLLDTNHGADYFRRWHRDKANSGGLLVHKSTHHFDLVNWWLNDDPEEVFAWGRLAFYGRINAEKRGVTQFYDHSREAQAKGIQDPFLFRWNDPMMKGLYADAEKEDGYIRDRSVFNDGINIEDSLSVMVRYRRKTVLNYSLNAFCPWEGYRVMFTGTKGRIEMEVVERGFVPGGGDVSFDPSYQDHGKGPRQSITLQKQWEGPVDVPWTEGKGGHGGGDGILLQDIFTPGRIDPYCTAANHLDGYKSILVGIAGNRSIAERRPVRVSELFNW